MFVLVTVAAVGAASCTSPDSDGSATSSLEVSVTTLSATQTTDSGGDTTTSTTQALKTVLTAPAYQIVERIEGEVLGDTVVVLLDPATYVSLTDLDLYDLIAEVVELFPPLSVVHVVDDPAAANVVANPDVSEAELQAVSNNYLARLDDGFRVTYLGPFAASGTAVLGS